MRTTTLIPIAASLALLAHADDSTTTSSSSATATTGIPATYTHDVKVGSNGLTIEPDSLAASPGDLINFHFYASNHSIAQSSYDKPCEPLDGGIFSGFFGGQSGNDENAQVFSMRLNGTDPVWLYCSFGEHCKAGQAMVINAPSGNDQTLNEYKDKAKKADPKSPSNVYGGVVRDKPSSTANSSPSSPSATKKSGAARVGSAGCALGLLAGVAAAMCLL